MSELSVSIATELKAIDPLSWDACAFAPGLSPDEPCNPFLSHAFLSALESSGCVGERAGWAPVHILAEREGVLVGAAPCYVKSHSQGEYVFDHAWADAYERAGGRYYPKLQMSVPFTPATGPRLLVREGGGAEVANALIQGAEALRTKLRASSVHATFLAENQARQLEGAGWLLRNDQQFHWMDEGYGDFEGFLAALASRKRKTIRKERKEALAPGIVVKHLTGRDITEAHWDAFHSFYMDTGSRKWGRPYLNRRFFSLVGEAMADRILLIMAERAGKPIAGAINFIGDRVLYGRNWGCVEDHPFLHFEVCYYQAIDFALARGLTRVEAGAQGEHKLARGYRPVTTWSAHDFADPGMKKAVADYLRRERRYVEQAGAQLSEALPFRRNEAAD